MEELILRALRIALAVDGKDMEVEDDGPVS